MYAHSYVLAKILLTLSTHFPEECIDKWFSDAEVIECSEDKVILYSPSPENRNSLQEQCYPYILELVKNLLQCNVSLEIWGRKELLLHTQHQAKQPHSPKPQYRFDNFAIGPSNEMAVKLARTVVTPQKEVVYNPFFIYGPSGVGKTHLLCAIANEMHISMPEANICYVLADTFVGELIWGLQNGRYDDFRQKYRSADVLIVDDIQFLAGKVSTQEELYYIVDYLHQNNKQLIFSSNSYPSTIHGLESYLCSKFEQGVILGIKTPDIEIRQSVITRFSQMYNLKISNASTQFIADAFPDNIRKLVGAMKMLRAAHDLNDLILSEDNIKTLFENQLRFG